MKLEKFNLDYRITPFCQTLSVILVINYNFLTQIYDQAHSKRMNSICFRMLNHMNILTLVEGYYAILALSSSYIIIMLALR